MPGPPGRQGGLSTFARGVSTSIVGASDMATRIPANKTGNGSCRLLRAITGERSPSHVLCVLLVRAIGERTRIQQDGPTPRLKGESVTELVSLIHSLP